MDIKKHWRKQRKRSKNSQDQKQEKQSKENFVYKWKTILKKTITRKNKGKIQILVEKTKNNILRGIKDKKPKKKKPK